MANAADAAIAYALAQVGKPYCWGGTGPSCFDCSGLVMKAYEAGGVNLPRVVPTQYNACVVKNIPENQLQPGDIVIPYSDFSHDQIYIGSGNICEAPHTGANVRVVKIWGFYTAGRPTGTPGSAYTGGLTPAGTATTVPGVGCAGVASTGTTAAICALCEIGHVLGKW